MTLISTSRRIKSSDEKIWSIISNVDEDPDFWHGIKAVKNIKKEGNTIERETIISFRHSKCIELVTLTPQKQIAIIIREGSIIGTKIIKLTKINSDECEIKVDWDIRMKGLMSLFTFFIKKHVLKGTDEALERIAKKVEH